MSNLSEDVSIKALIQSVSDQLLRSQQERLAAGRDALFEVSDLTLEVSFVVTTSKHGGGGFDLKVVKADGGVKYDEGTIQKVSLKLSAVKSQPQPFGGFAPVRPRIESEGK